MDVFILLGQSNMSGRGTLPVTLNDRKSNSSNEKTIVNEHEILYFDKNNQWVPAKHPLHYDKLECGVGPGLSFASELCQLNGLPKYRKIGLIPCAVGGTSINGWLPPTITIPLKEEQKSTPENIENHNSSSSLSITPIPNETNTITKDNCFEMAMQRINMSKSNYDQPLEINIKGILWHQGESDCQNLQDAKAYLDKILTVLTEFRKALNNPNLPILVGGLGEFLAHRNDEQYRYYAIINEALADIPKRLSNTAYITAEGLSHKGDFLHFDAESAQKFGVRYAQAYARLSGANVNTIRQLVARTSGKAVESTRGVGWKHWVGVIGLCVVTFYAWREWKRRSMLITTQESYENRNSRVEPSTNK